MTVLMSPASVEQDVDDDRGAQWGMAVRIGDTWHTAYVRLLPKHLREQGGPVFEAIVDQFVDPEPD